jgi:monooxygenase
MTDREHLDVLVVGAGLSGIGAGWYLQDKTPWARWAIFEARDAIGGTWDLFRYPGIRSDSDMYTLGYSFRPWPGEKTIADGPSILRYIEDTAAEYGMDEKIRVNHRIVSADWSTPEARWHVVAERTDTGERIELTAGFLFSCSGYYRYDRGYEPEFPGLDDFRGQVVRPQFWPEDLDYEGKRVVVIGSGATAITLVPSMAEGAGHVTMLQRSPTYVISMPASSPVAPFLRKVLPDKLAGNIMRWILAMGTQGSYFLSQWKPGLVKKVIRRAQERQLPDGFDMTHFTPRYDPWDQRMCVVPDGDLFKAIRKGKVDIVTDHVDTFTEKGIRLQSGTELEADIVVTATGLELLFLGGIDLRVDGEPVDVSERLVYKGMMLEGVPNAALAIGYTNASWTLKCDLTCDYVTKLLGHMRETGTRQCTPTNHDAAVSPAPLLGLSSGYITRAADRFPKQGSRFPWQVKQSYLTDYRALKLKPVVDDAMVFSNPAPGGAGGVEPAPAKVVA